MRRALALVAALSAFVLLVPTFALFPSTAQAATYTWDASGTGARTDGSGSWTTTNANWWNGSSDVNWTTTGIDTAVFGNGGAGGTVTTAAAANVFVGAIVFNPVSANYTISDADGLILGGSGSQYLLGSGANGTGAAGIYDNATGVTTISGAGGIFTTGPNTWSTVAGGTLAVNTPVWNDYYNGPGFGNITTIGLGVVSITNATQNFYGTYNATSGTLNMAMAYTGSASYGWGTYVGPNGTVNVVNPTAGFHNSVWNLGGVVGGSGVINVNNAGAGIGGGWVLLYNAHQQNEASTAFEPAMYFTGTININSGVLGTETGGFGTGGQVLGSAVVNVSSSGVMALHQATSGWTIGALNGSGSVAAATGLATAPTYTLTVGAANLSGSFTGDIFGNNTTGGVANDGTLQAGYLALTKIGNGVQSLSGSNTYTGLTTAAGGELLLDFSAASAPSSNILFGSNGTLGVVALSGGTLGANAGSTTANSQSVASIAVGAGGLNISNMGKNMTLTAGSLTRAAGGMMTLNLVGGAGSNTLNLTNTTGLNQTSPNNVIGWIAVQDANGTGFGSLSGSSIVRNTTTSPLTPGSNSATTDFTTTPSDGNYSSGTLTLGGNAAADSLAIAATSNGVINLGGNTLSLTSSGVLMYGSGGNYTISNGQLGATGAGVIVNQLGAGNLTISSSISGGAGTFSVGGGGNVYLTGSSSYSGGTYIGNGLLNITSSTAIGTGSIAFNGNGTLQAGANNIVLGNNISIANAVGATFDTLTNTMSANGTISGAGGLVKNGPGTLVLGGTNGSGPGNGNTYTGGTTINGGILSCGSLSQGGYPIGSASSLGEGTNLTFNGGILLYTGTATGGIDSVSASGNGNSYTIQVLAGGGTLECPNGNITMNGVLEGSGNLTIANPTVSGIANMLAHGIYWTDYNRNSDVAFSGNIYINNGGVLQVRNNSANELGNAASVIIGPNGVLTADADTTIGITDGDGPVQCALPIVLNGGTLATQNPNYTYYGQVTVNPSTKNYVGTINSESGAVTLAGNLIGSGTLITTGTGGVNSTNGVTLAGVNSGFTGYFLSTNGSTAITSPNAGSAGAWWVANGQGFIAEIGGGGTINMGALSGTAGTLDNLVGSSTAIFSVGALNASTTFGGVITNGTGTTGLTVVGGSLDLTGANTYTGATTVTGGTLLFNGNTLLSGSSNNAITVEGGGALNLTNGTLSTGTAAFYVGNSTGPGTVNMSGGSIGFSANNNQLLIGNTGGNGTFNFNGGNITGGTASTASRGVMLGVNAGTAVTPIVATFNMNGGFLNMGISELAVGRNDSAQSYTTDSYSQSAGTAMFQYLSVGGSGGTSDIASFSVTGGFFSATTFQNLAAGSSSSASINIGGNAQVTLPPFPGNVGATSTATLTMNGGTLSANASSANYFNGVGFAYAGANGANFNIPSQLSATVTQGFQNLGVQNGALSVFGNGTLVLAGNNTYSGPTTINGGNLALNFAASTAPASNIVNSASSLVFGGAGSLTVQGSAAASNSQQFNGLSVGAGAGVASIAVTSGTSGGAATLSLGSIGYTSGFAVFTLPQNGNITTTNSSGTLGAWATISGGGLAYVDGFGNITSLPASAYANQVPVLGGTIPTGSPAPDVAIVDAGSTNGNIMLGGAPTTIDTLLQSATSSAATISLGGGTLQANGIMAQNSATSLTIGATPGDGVLSAATAGGALALYSGTSGITVNSVIADNTTASSLYTFGPGVTSVAAANTYSGPTTITGGSLAVIGTGSLGNGTYAGAIVNNGALVFNTSTAQILTGVMSGNGSLIANGPATLTMTGANTFNGGVVLNGGNLSVSSVSTGGTSAAALGEGPGNASGQSLTFNGGMLTYTGPSTSAANATYNAAGYNANITLNAGGGTLNLPNGTIAFTGGLSGVGTLTVVDTAAAAGATGTQVFFNTTTANASSNFTGNIIIGAGGDIQLRSSAANLFGNAASVTIDTGGILSSDKGATGATNLANALVLSGGSLANQGTNLNYSGNVTVSSNLTSYVGDYTGSSGSLTLGGALTGSGTVNTIGTQVVTLSGATSGFNGVWQNNSAPTTFTGNANGSTEAAFIANGQGFTASIAGGGTVSMGALSGNVGTVQNGLAGTTSVFSVGALGASTTFGGVMTNGGSTAITGLNVVGGGLALTGTYNYGGPTTVTGGTLQFGSVAAAPAPTSVVGNVALSNNSTLVFANAGTESYGYRASGSGGLVFAGPGTLSLGATQGYTGPTVVQAGTLSLYSPVSGFGNPTSGSAASQNNLTWQFNSSGASLTATPVTGGSLTLTNNNNSESRSAWDLTKVNPDNGFAASFVYTPTPGTVGTADGMVFVFQNASSTVIGGGGGGFYQNLTPDAGIALNMYSNVSQTMYAVNGSTAALTSGVLTNASSSFFHNGDPVTVNVNYNASTDILSWTLVNSASPSNVWSVSEAGVNMTSLVGSSAYIGFTGATGGASSTQVVSNFSYSPSSAINNTLPTTTALSMNGGATFDLAGANQTLGSLAGAGTVTNNLAVAPNTLTVGTDNSSQTFSGLLQDGAGTLAVAKIGSGMWTLAGNNTYSGGTTFTGGTLQLGNNTPTGMVGPGSFTMTNAWLSFNRSDAALSFPYPITSGTVSQDGSGMTTLALNNSYSGGTFINNGTLQVGNGGATGSLGSGPVTVNANGVLSLMRSDAIFTMANTLSGAGQIFQNGTGTATLSGPASGFNGTITVNNGNLYLNSTNSASYVTVAGGAVLGGKGTVSAGTVDLQNNASIEAGQGGTGNLTVAGLLLENAANININSILQYAASNNVAAITVTGLNALSAQTNSQYAIQFNIGGAPFLNTIPEDIRLLAYSGSANLGQLANLTNANNLNMNINGLSSRAVYGFLPLSADPGYIDLQVSVSYPVWTGSGNAVWVNNTNQSPQNWKLASNGAGNGTPTNFLVNDAAVFDDTAGAGHTLVLLNSGNVDPASVTFNNNSLSYTLSGAGAIEAGAVVTFNGSASVTIWNANSYYGGTTLNAGLLNIGNQYALGSAANYVANNATFTINGGSINNVTGAALTTDNYPIMWSGGFAFVGSNPLDLGTGIVTLGTSTAAVNVSGSTLELDGPIGDNFAGYGFTQTGAGVFVLTGSSTYLGPTVVNGGTLQIGNGGSGASIGSTSGVSLAASTLLLFNHNDSQTFPASISGSGAVTQSGAGLLNLTNSNTYTGGTTVASGSLELSFNGPAGTLAPNTTVAVNSLATLVLNAQYALGASGSYTNVSLTGGTVASAGVGNYSLGGTVSATADSSGNPAAITATQISLGSNTVLNVTHAATANPADLVVTSAISSVPSGYGLTLQGNGFTQFYGANTYNGGTTVSGGTLQLESGATLSASTGGLTVNAPALLDMNAVNVSVGALNGSGTIDNVGTYGSPVLTVGNGNGTGTFSGTIQNSSGVTTLVKAGNGTQYLTGTNTYSGGTTINAGVLNFGPSALGSSPVTFEGGTLQWAAGNTLDVSSSPGIASIPSGKTANLDTNGNNVTFGASLNGAGGLTKIGAGTLTLNAPNYFTGTTNITGGTLNLANSYALQSSTANVTINNSLVLSSGAASAVTLGGLSGSGAFNLGAAALTVGGDNATTTYSGVLGGGTGLIKTGTGTLTLNTPNINGAINIEAGVLAVQNNTVAIKVGSAISAADGPNGAVTGKWNNLAGASPSSVNLVDNFSLSTGASMSTSTNLTSGTYAIAGNTDPLLASYIFTASSGSVTGNLTVNLTGIPYSSYSIYAFSSDATAGHQNALTIGGNTYYFAASTGSTFSQITNSSSTSYPTGNYAVVTGLSGASQTLTITGSPDTGFSGFEIVNTANTMANSPVTISGGGTLNMTGGMQTVASLNSTDGMGSKVLLGNGFLTVGNAGSSTFDGVISGSGGQVALQGHGSMLFTGSNTYTGATTVSGGGTLQLGDGAVNNGNVAGNVALANNSALVFANPTNLSYAGAISGTGSLTKNAAGTVQMTGNSTYSGPTVINAGTVQLGMLNTLAGFGANTGSGSANGVNVPPGVVVHPNNGTWTLNTLGGYGGTSAAPQGFKYTPVTNGVLDLTDGTSGTNGSDSYGYKGSRSAFYNTPLPVNSSFNMTFTYTSSAVDSAGYQNYDTGFSVVIQNDSRGAQAIGGPGRGFGVGTNPEGNNGGTSPIGKSVDLNYDLFSYAGEYNGVPIQVLGPATGYNTNGGTNTSTGYPTAGLPVFGGAASTYNNITGDPINMTVSYNAVTDVLTWSGTDVAGNPPNPSTFSYSQTGVNLQSITGGTSAYIGFTGSDGEFGSTQLISNFDFTGLAAAPNNVLPSTTPLYVASGGSLDLFGNNQTVGDLTGPGVVTNSYGPSISTLSVGTDNTSQTFVGTLQDGAGSLALVKVGTGSLTLANANPYSGGTTVANGILQLGNAGAIGSGALAANGGSLDMNGYSVTVPSFSGVAGIVTTSVPSVAATLTVNQPNSTVFGGSITDGKGQLALALTGTGSLTITGSNTYSGATTIASGTLQLGTGVSGQDGSISNTLGVADSGALVFDIAGTQTAAYAINGTGSLTMEGSGVVTLSGTNTYLGGTTVTNGELIVSSPSAIDNDQIGTNLYVGNNLGAFFGTAVPAGAPVAGQPEAAAASALAATSAVPEPGTLALLAAALAGAAVYRRRSAAQARRRRSECGAGC